MILSIMDHKVFEVCYFCILVSVQSVLFVVVETWCAQFNRESPWCWTEICWWEKRHCLYINVNDSYWWNGISILFVFSDFEAEPHYPKQNARFLDMSFRGICTDAKGKQHPIEKDIITSKHRRKKKHLLFLWNFPLCRSYYTIEKGS